MYSLKVPHWRVRPRHGLLLLMALSLAILAVTGAAPVTAQADSQSSSALPASVTVDASDDLGTVAAHPFGVNAEVWDGNMNDSVIPGLLKAAGITAMRYPGGSYSDMYDWETNTAPGGYVASGTDFSDFMQTAQAANAQPVITVNYGSGTPALAASWVQDADVTNNYGIEYWEVGNEVYGNGFYGADWEEDNHSSKSPDTYAANFLQYQSAMLAVDPNIKVCTVLTLPGNWPDGNIGPGDTMDWNHTVLSIIGSKLQCVIEHDYPSQTTATGVLGQPASIPGWMSTLHSEINEYAGSDGPSIPIIVTETDSNGVGLDSQPGALFTADTVMSMLENGAVNVDYWDEHNGGSGTTTDVDGVPDYDDGGMFSSASSGEPAVNTPFAPYYAMMLLSKLASPGDEMVGSSSGNSLIRVHAVQTSGGNMDVLVENEDPSNSYTVGLNYDGFTPSGSSPTVYTYDNGAQSVSASSQSSTSSVTVAPYSLTVLQIPGSAGSGGTSSGGGSTSSSSGTSAIVSSYDTSKCVDDNGDSAADGTHVQMWDCNGGAAQDWALETDGTVQLNGKCLDVTGKGTANGTLVELWDCNGGSNQQWSKGSAGTLVNPASGKCLDDPGWDTADGTQLQIYTCNGGSNQQWKLPAAPIESFYDPSKCVDDNGGSAADGTAVVIWDCNGTAAQDLTLATDDTVQLNGKCLDVTGGGTANGSLVELDTCSGGSNQQWTVVNGTLVNPASGKCLDDTNWDTANGTQLQIWTCDGDPVQMWTLP
jgi:hypothetical protein